MFVCLFFHFNGAIIYYFVPWKVHGRQVERFIHFNQLLNPFSLLFFPVFIVTFDYICVAAGAASVLFCSVVVLFE